MNYDEFKTKVKDRFLIELTDGDHAVLEDQHLTSWEKATDILDEHLVERRGNRSDFDQLIRQLEL